MEGEEGHTGKAWASMEEGLIIRGKDHMEEGQMIPAVKEDLIPEKDLIKEGLRDNQMNPEVKGGIMGKGGRATSTGEDLDRIKRKFF